MVIEKRKFIFKTINVILEDDKFAEARRTGGYSKISATSYNQMKLTNFDELVKTTALINLRSAEDDIFAKFNDTTRNEIRKTYKNPDLKFILDDKNFEESYDLYKNFEYAQGRVPVGTDELKKHRLFSGYYKGEMISAVYVAEAMPYLRIRSIFSKRLQTEDRDMYKIISNATRRIIWEICIWGKKNGFQSLDLASVNFKNPKTANITKFKMSFGGDVVNEYTYTYKSKIFRVFEKMATARVFIKKLIHKFLQ